MITAVVGAQFGSEGKGAIVGHIAKDFDLHVRVGAANAGHTVYVDGEKHVVQQLPVAAYAAPEAALLLGPGALISISILAGEIEENRRWRARRGCSELRLAIDPRAHIVRQVHIDAEQESGLAERIGSTSTIAKEGIGTATAARVMRSEVCLPVEQQRVIFETYDVTIEDGPDLIADADNVLLEGTQGTGLSLTTGAFPYVTSRNTTAAGLAADCGVGPRDVDEVIAVMRTYPIRVAGNSGPFYPDSVETSFGEIGVPEERTTVTKLVRRIASFSMQQAKDAVKLNSASWIALTFADYVAPELTARRHFRSDGVMWDNEGRLLDLVHNIETFVGCPVHMIGTGPDTIIDRRPDKLGIE